MTNLQSDMTARAEAALLELKNTPQLQSYWRQRQKYYLNVVYPPASLMQDMSEADELVVLRRRETKKVALYFHIPFCSYLCHFCHYYKLISQPADVVAHYMTALKREIEMRSPYLKDATVHSIYFGGGTPAYLSSAQIGDLMAHIRAHFNLEKDIEITFEADPANCSEEKLAVLAELGVTRLSVGVQSFHDNILAAVNRRHSVAEALTTFEQASKLPFQSVNIDLIYGLIYQNLAAWEENLDYVRRLSPKAVTFYYLRLRKGTPTEKKFGKQAQNYASEDDLIKMRLMTEEFMQERGYSDPVVDYYVSDPELGHKFDHQVWGRPESYNLIGFGASAYSYIGGTQYYNLSTLNDYVSAVLEEGRLPTWRGYQLSRSERMRRNLFLGLKVGITKSYWNNAFGTDLAEAFPEEMAPLLKDGMLAWQGEELRLTRLGRLFSDEVGQRFARLEKKLEPVN